jgi:fructose-1,6-bisphosphatase/inositol monophosphatase family enzyme
MLDEQQIQEVGSIIRQCASDIVLPLHGRLSPDQIQFKGGNPCNQVTQADQESELFLSSKFIDLLPGSKVLGEEAVEDNPALLDLFHETDMPVWVIDPIDGTGNFIQGSPDFCLMVALVKQGRVEMSWILDACEDSLAVAVRGQGVQIDGKSYSVEGSAASDIGLGYAGYRFIDRIDHMNVKTLRCSGLEYFRMVKGEAAFSVYSMMKPWDHLAGTLMVREAGGLAQRWDRSPYVPGQNAGGLITAINQQIWDRVHGQIPEHVLSKYATRDE